MTMRGSGQTLTLGRLRGVRRLPGQRRRDLEHNTLCLSHLYSHSHSHPQFFLCVRHPRTSPYHLRFPGFSFVSPPSTPISFVPFLTPPCVCIHTPSHARSCVCVCECVCIFVCIHSVHVCERAHVHACACKILPAPPPVQAARYRSFCPPARPLLTPRPPLLKKLTPLHRDLCPLIARAR